MQAVASFPEGSRDSMTGVTYSQTALSGQEWYFHLPHPSEIHLLRKSRNSPAAVSDGHQELGTVCSCVIGKAPITNFSSAAVNAVAN